MAVHSINDVSYDKPGSTSVVKETVAGQPQAKPRPLDDGKVQVSETSVQLDTVVLDPNSELAVQVPEGVGATTVGDPNPLAAALEAGTPEEQYAKLPQSSDSVRKSKPAKD